MDLMKGELDRNFFNKNIIFKFTIFALNQISKIFY